MNRRKQKHSAYAKCLCLTPGTGHRLRRLRSFVQENTLRVLSFSSFATPNHFCYAKDLVLAPSLGTNKNSPHEVDYFCLAPPD